MTYNILIHPNKNLRQKAKIVEKFDNNLAKIAEKMFATMYKARGIGLAATQVDIHKQIVVMDSPIVRVDAEEKSPPVPSIKRILINPQIINQSKETATHTEGCLSLPNQFATVKRPKTITFRYQDLGGAIIEETLSDLAGVCVQHEIDHLNGILFIDHLSALKRSRIEKKLIKNYES